MIFTLQTKLTFFLGKHLMIDGTMQSQILNDHTTPGLRNSFVRRNVDQFNNRLCNSTGLY